jgi:predicted acetyltransferase
LQFQEPNETFQNSYRELIREFIDAGEPLIPFPLTFPNDDFPAFLSRLAAATRGEGLRPGAVAHSTFWLVADHEVVGVSNLRHSLTESLRREGGNIGFGVRPSARQRGYAKELLRHTLLRAGQMGLSEILLTCAKSNVASARTILSQGGIFMSEDYLEDRCEIVQRYQIRMEPIMCRT